MDEHTTEIRQFEAEINDLKKENERYIEAFKDFKGVFEANKKLKAELELHRWIPVSERLPEKSDIYWIVVTRTETPRYVTTLRYDAVRGWASGHTITHWKPIILPTEQG